MTKRNGKNPRVWTTAVREALLLGGASVVLAAVVWAVRPDRLPLRAQAEVYELELAAPAVGVAEAVSLFTAGTHLFVDVREETAGVEIPGGFRVRLSAFDTDLSQARDFLYPEDHLILYDDGVMQSASAAATHFLARGYANVSILKGGLPAWRAAGGPISGGDGDAQ